MLQAFEVPTFRKRRERWGTHFVLGDLKSNASLPLCIHVGAEDGEDAGLVAALLAFFLAYPGLASGAFLCRRFAAGVAWGASFSQRPYCAAYLGAEAPFHRDGLSQR